MQLKLLKEDCKEWREFLKDTEHLIIHTPEWKQFIEATFPRTKAKYYALESQGKIKFLFPTFHTFASFLPNKSAAFIEYGGPIGKANKRQFNQIKERLPENIEIRQGLCNDILRKNFVEVKAFKRFVLPLKSEDELWKHIHKAKRKAVRMAEKSGVTVKDVPKKDLPELYYMYLKAMKVFGSAPFSKKYFENFYTYFIDKNMGRMLGAYYDGKLVAILSGYMIGKRIHINMNVSDTKYLQFRPNDALHWEFIRWGCSKKYKVFDFGAARVGSGQFSFKKKWKAELHDLSNFYFKKPKIGLDVSSPLFKIPIVIWKMTPLPLAKLVGPLLRETVRI
ncbi:GNAT family N-acetyltransferase [Candidatus Woesearchaeota archaeon]|jgi:hypothetical protein|nr:GNAT family N-acetyltransferase [Candidatus Woesearchaeota archaeon]MBT4114305.1 GNAT family N-acetyltransferase [Candidatus Woesearchaeota archaeon]MBT4248449.1 GNAT family N-acetyltransferase [Candidatus Woesearchaeota archaeon]